MLYKNQCLNYIKLRGVVYYATLVQKNPDKTTQYQHFIPILSTFQNYNSLIAKNQKFQKEPLYLTSAITMVEDDFQI